MKAIMYHYVREATPDLPYFRYLHVDDFRRQLDDFAADPGFVSRGDYDQVESRRSAPEGVVLTFDDGLSDHYDFVFPILRDRGLWGVFYIPTDFYETGRMLDVHRIHWLLGRAGAEALAERLESRVRPEMLVDSAVEEFQRMTYRRQDNDQTVLVKRILNYYVSYRWRDVLLDDLMKAFCPDEAAVAAGYYLTEPQMREMQREGMIIGSHGVRHLVFSKLPVPEQRREIRDSFERLDTLLGRPVETFCYPYGGFHTFTADTESLLEAQGCRIAYNVDFRDVEDRDVRDRPQALPRYDCNCFPHGQASMGDRRAVPSAVPA